MRKNVFVYISSGIILLIVFIITVIPTIIGGSEFLYNEGSLRILYAAISLAVAMITFGVLGDSGALVKFQRQKGTLTSS